MSLTGLILGVINIAITIAILILVGLIIVWFLSWCNVAVPDQVKKVYLLIVALIGLYMIVALLLGIPSISVIGSPRRPVL